MIRATPVSTMLTSSPAKKAWTLHVQAPPSPLWTILKEGEENILERGGEACTELQNEKQAKSTENFLYLHAVVMCI